MHFTVTRVEHHNFLDTVEIDDRAAVNALKTVRFESRLDAVHGLAQRVYTLTHVQVDVVAGRFDPIDVDDTHQEFAAELFDQEPVVPLILYGNFVYPRFPYINHNLIGDWYAHALYFTFFLYGFLLGRDEGIWNELTRLRSRTLALAIAAFALLLAHRELVPDDPAPWQDQLGMFLTYANRWLWLLTVLGWGHRLLNRPFRWLPYATETVYPRYILHYTITIVAGYQPAKLALGPVVEPALVLAITIGGCLVLHEFVIRRTTVLRPLFGLPMHRNTA